MKNNEFYHKLMRRVYLLLVKLCKLCEKAYRWLSDYFAYKKRNYERAHRMMDYATKMQQLKFQFGSKELDHKYWVRPY